MKEKNFANNFNMIRFDINQGKCFKKDLDSLMEELKDDGYIIENPIKCDYKYTYFVNNRDCPNPMFANGKTEKRAFKKNNLLFLYSAQTLTIQFNDELDLTRENLECIKEVVFKLLDGEFSFIRTITYEHFFSHCIVDVKTILDRYNCFNEDAEKIKKITNEMIKKKEKNSKVYSRELNTEEELENSDEYNSILKLYNALYSDNIVWVVTSIMGYTKNLRYYDEEDIPNMIIDMFNYVNKDFYSIVKENYIDNGKIII